MQVLRNGRNYGLMGPPQDLVRGANSMLGKAGIQDNSLPYWWETPRANTQVRQPMLWIPAPVAGVLTQVMSYTVPVGFRFVMRGIRQNFATGSSPSPFVEGSQDILWSITVDAPVGATALSGYALPDLGNMAEERGSKEQWWILEGYNVFDPYQTLSYQVLTTNNIPSGSPNFIGCGIFGWEEQYLTQPTD